MIYIVSGYRRTGTSAMMKALHAGGISAIYMPDLDEQVNPNHNGYQPNPGGLYEVGLNQYMNVDFLREISDESVVKILFDGLPFLPYRDYKIIWMERDLEEIQASTERVDLHIIEAACGAMPSDEGVKYALQKKAEKITKLLPFNCFKPYNQKDMDHVLGICEARSDMCVIKIQFSELIRQPQRVFTTLKLMGVPINVHKAAAVIDEKLYRVRKEECPREKQA